MPFHCFAPVDLKNPVDPNFPPPESWKWIDTSDHRRGSSDLRECCEWEGAELNRIVSNPEVSLETLLLVVNNYGQFRVSESSPCYAPVGLAQEKILEMPDVPKKEILRLVYKGVHFLIREKAQSIIASCLPE